MKDDPNRLGTPARRQAICGYFEDLEDTTYAEHAFVWSLKRHFQEQGDLTPLQFDSLKEMAERAQSNRAHRTWEPKATEKSAADLFRAIDWQSLMGDLRSDMLSIKARFDKAGALSPKQLSYVAGVARRFPKRA